MHRHFRKIHWLPRSCRGRPKWFAKHWVGSVRTPASSPQLPLCSSGVHAVEERSRSWLARPARGRQKSRGGRALVRCGMPAVRARLPFPRPDFRLSPREPSSSWSENQKEDSPFLPRGPSPCHGHTFDRWVGAKRVTFSPGRGILAWPVRYGSAAYGSHSPDPPTLATRGSLPNGAWEPRRQTAPPQEPKSSSWRREKLSQRPRTYLVIALRSLLHSPLSIL